MIKKLFLTLLFSLFLTTSVFGIGFDSDTKLLIHFDGSDGSTDDYTAETGQTVSLEGTAQLDTAQKKFGTASLLLDGNSDYVTIPDSADWTFGSGNFTIDFWMRYTGTLNSYASLSLFYTTYGFTYMFLDTRTDGALYFALYVDEGSILVVDSSTAITADEEHHVAVVRNGDNLALYLDGVSVANGNFSEAYSLPDFTQPIRMGNNTSTRYFNGWIDEYRISKGVARWTANFTPPVSEYTWRRIILIQ